MWLSLSDGRPGSTNELHYFADTVCKNYTDVIFLEEQTFPQILKGLCDPKVITDFTNYYCDSTRFALIPLLAKESCDS